MRVYSSITFDMTKPLPNGKFEVLSATWSEYSGPVGECKGDSSAQSAEQSQVAFQQTLQKVFSSQFNQQQGIYNFLRGPLESMITNPQGYSADALAAMRTSATDQISQSYGNAEKALQAKNFALGGRDLPSGVFEQQMGGLEAGQASDTASAQNQITQQNANLQQQNYWNAIGALSGQQQQLNPLGYAGSATGAASSVAGLSQAYTQSQQSQLLGALGGAVGGLASGWATGGFKMPCWIAEAIYGQDDIRVLSIRAWLVQEYEHTFVGRVVVGVYRLVGRPVAFLVKRSSLLQRLFKPLFDAALTRAQVWQKARL